MSVTHILIQTTMSNVKLHQSFFQLVTVPIHFPFEVVQKCQHCPLYVLRENSNDVILVFSFPLFSLEANRYRSKIFRQIVVDLFSKIKYKECLVVGTYRFFLLCNMIAALYYLNCTFHSEGKLSSCRGLNLYPVLSQCWTMCESIKTQLYHIYLIPLLFSTERTICHPCCSCNCCWSGTVSCVIRVDPFGVNVYFITRLNRLPNAQYMKKFTLEFIVISNSLTVENVWRNSLENVLSMWSTWRVITVMIL